jgi:hypothetical protein
MVVCRAFVHWPVLQPDSELKETHATPQRYGSRQAKLLLGTDFHGVSLLLGDMSRLLLTSDSPSLGGKMRP